MDDHRTEDTGDRSNSSERRIVSSSVFDRENGVDNLLTVLSRRRRRDVLYYLSERELADVDEVAAAIATREADRPSKSARDAVEIDLIHNHLPKLSDRGLVEYDRRSGVVRWSTPPEELETLLECCRTLESND